MNRMLGIFLGGTLIVIALILGVVQIFTIYNIYGTPGNKWYFYGLVGAIGLVGILLTAWSYMKTEQPTKAGE